MLNRWISALSLPITECVFSYFLAQVVKVLANFFKPSNTSLNTTEYSNLQQHKNQTLSQLQNTVILLHISFLTRLLVTTTRYVPPLNLVWFPQHLAERKPAWWNISTTTK